MEPGEERVEGVLCRTPKGAAVMIQETDNADTAANTAANTAIGFDTDGNILCLSQTNPVEDLPRRERDGLQSAS